MQKMVKADAALHDVMESIPLHAGVNDPMPMYHLPVLLS